MKVGIVEPASGGNAEFWSEEGIPFHVLLSGVRTASAPLPEVRALKNDMDNVETLRVPGVKAGTVNLILGSTFTSLKTSTKKPSTATPPIFEPSTKAAAGAAPRYVENRSLVPSALTSA